MNRRKELIEAVFGRLFDAYGPQDWWPAQTPFEVIVGAILTQNTAWKNVEKCIANLREHGLLTFEAIYETPVEQLSALIRSSGYYNQKAKKLKAFCNRVQDGWDGNLDGFLSMETEVLRTELLQIHGIGPETADSIVLYAADKPSFVVDAYTYRIFSRHGWVDDDINYPALRDYFMDALDPGVPVFKEYHALLVRTGHLHCRRRPSCGYCPLNTFWDNR